ncbi:excinuclease ABC subunit A [Reticulibacter mediterranei]|uniref:UvrABC system protein A n=1 Tax=Reticulibacter mediterranei TaxID=2778369 RepID=A0A8J3N4G5_9CHLR|nr:excinuclease ABC subunit UvrA [Reticulibacter mediterranei]GHO98004.1 excinuclease ABC subunit A [Reticulibacter mediterranei]
MVQEYIEIRSARENNLKDVSLRLPKRKIIIFTGVSGSGKSSVVFDTIANEAQRLLFENFSMFIRNLLPRYPQPDADVIENLSMAVLVDQKRLGGGSQSTVGTVTDIAPVLRLLFSRIGTPYVGYANAFSFNDPQGMCLECNGLGRKVGITLEALIDKTKSLNEGAVIAPGLANWESDLYASSGFFDNDKKVADYTTEELDLLLYSEPRKHNGLAYNTYEGLVYKFNRKFVTRDIQTLSPRIRQKVEPFLKLGPCPLCKGARLNQAALSCKINGYNIAQFATMEVDELIEVIKEIKDPAVAPVIQTLTARLQHLVDIGLEYLSLDRITDTLSGGESQRVKIVKHLNGSLVDVMYIFDEPSVGLHPRDVHRLNELLEKLRDKGNTVIVVEHDPDVIKVADYIVDMGPYAGSGGGQVVYEGSFAGLLKADTLTGNHLLHKRPLKDEFRQATGVLPIVHATVNNLKDVSVDIPAGVLTVITGVAGSGKSSLINEAFLSQHQQAVVIDQSPVGVSSRSNPATYTGIMDDVRKVFAAVNRVDAGLFSFNSKGACPNCQGLGVTYADLGFLEGVKLPCEVCGGKRFKDEVLTYTLNGKSIADVLGMTIHQALEFFTIKEVLPKLQAMSDVGLDYLTLGQPLSTLSGGECQRLKLASELHKHGSVYIMDEPTTGLHLSDIGRLLTIMNRLVDGGNTVIVIEHHLDVIRNADWIIDMGPEGGNKGGLVIFEGTPRELLGAKHSLTSQYLG